MDTWVNVTGTRIRGMAKVVDMDKISPQRSKRETWVSGSKKKQHAGGKQMTKSGEENRWGSPAKSNEVEIQGMYQLNNGMTNGRTPIWEEDWIDVTGIGILQVISSATDRSFVQAVGTEDRW